MSPAASTSQAATMHPHNAAPSSPIVHVVEEPFISEQLRTPASVGHLSATSRHMPVEPASMEESRDDLLNVSSTKDNLQPVPVPAAAPAEPDAAVQSTEPPPELDSSRLGSGSICGAASRQTDTPSAELRPTRPVPAPSEHSAPSTVDELELFDQDAGRNAKALRTILRNMGKDNSKLNVAVHLVPSLALLPRPNLHSLRCDTDVDAQMHLTRHWGISSSLATRLLRMIPTTKTLERAEQAPGGRCSPAMRRCRCGPPRAASGLQISTAREQLRQKTPPLLRQELRARRSLEGLQNTHREIRHSCLAASQVALVVEATLKSRA